MHKRRHAVNSRVTAAYNSNLSALRRHFHRLFAAFSLLFHCRGKILLIRQQLFHQIRIDRIPNNYVRIFKNISRLVCHAVRAARAYSNNVYLHLIPFQKIYFCFKFSQRKRRSVKRCFALCKYRARGAYGALAHVINAHRFLHKFR